MGELFIGNMVKTSHPGLLDIKGIKTFAFMQISSLRLREKLRTWDS